MNIHLQISTSTFSRNKFFNTGASAVSHRAEARRNKAHSRIAHTTVQCMHQQQRFIPSVIDIMLACTTTSSVLFRQSSARCETALAPLFNKELFNN